MGDRYPFFIVDRKPHREPYRDKIGTDRGAATKFVRCLDKCCELGRFAFIIGDREPYRTKIQTDNGPPFGAVRGP
jgi:hypothetical protein